jgi:ClpP class serine protease
MKKQSSINRLKKQNDLPLAVGREVDEEVRRMLDDVLEENQAALQITSPYGREKVSTKRSEGASFNQMDERSVEYAIRDIDEDIDDLKLVITSPGGRVSSANKIARSIKNNFDSIETYVPHFAKSGGTLISLTGEEIVMGEISDLGPLDPQMPMKDGGRSSSRDVIDSYHRWIDQWQKKHPSEASAPEQSMIERMDILEYEEAKKSLDEMKNYTQDILSSHDNISEKEARKTVENLVDGFPVHGYTLTYEDATEVLPDNMITPETERQEEMDVLRRWMDEYAFDNSSHHAVVYHEK